MDNLTLAANASGCFSVDTPFRRRLFLLYYLTVIIIGVPANAFSLYVSCQHIRRKNDLGVYLFHLALSDLTFTLGLSLWMDFLWRGVWDHGGYLCLVSVYSLYTNFYTSEALLCCIAVTRYLAVVHPLKCAWMRKVSTAAVIAVAMWVLVMGFNASTITWEDSYQETSMFSLCYEIFLPVSQTLVNASIARFFLGFVVPVLIVFYSTWSTCLAVKSNRATVDEERLRILKLLTVVLLCLVLCFGPVHVVMIVRMLLLHGCVSFKWFLCIYKVSLAISSINCLIDPLLYCFITRTGQENVKQVLIFFLGKQRSTEEVNYVC
ncbi:psychosine receptor-like [Fundulus heteroclitus]|uniref:psychosine receptor-like n=1 Tax=Fundulus heteroclitus TaxID=8078 RepID=UPI00165ACE5B|nr:psychosine receptor-like [Fundulus heteroclitus]